MTERRVVELVVDSRGAEQGFSRYATAATQAGAASDRAAEAEDRLQAVMAKATAARERVVDDERRVEAAMARQAQGIVASTRLVAERASSFTRMAAAIDPVVRAEQAMERATHAADAAVRRGAATTDEAARVVGLYRQRHDEAAAAADRAAAATRRLTAAQASQVQTRIEGATGVKVDFGTAGRGADIAAYSAEMDRVRAKLIPLAAAQQTYRSQLAEIAQAAKVGAISESERSVALARTKEAFAGQVAAIRIATTANDSSAKSTALHGQAWQNLGFQVNDAATMLLSGSSAFQVVATQGGQVYQILSGAQGGVGGALKEIGNFLVGLLTPARLLVGGLIGIGLAGVAAGLSWQGTQADIRRALAGVGRAAGATVGDIEGIASATVAASDTSISAARALTLELVKTGKIGRDSLAPIAAVGKDFAATLGLDATEGGQVLARSFAEPAKGAEELARRYGLLSDATVEYVRHLENSNERGRAQQALLDALRPKLVSAAELTTGWARAWDAVANAARGAWDWIGKTADKAAGGTGGGTDEEIRAALQDRLRYQRSAAGRAASSRGGDLEASNQAIADTERQLAALEQRVAKARTSAQDAAKNDLSLRAGLIARATTPEVQALDELIAKRKTLGDAVASQGAGPGLKEQAVALARLDAQIRDFTAAGGAMELQERKRAEASKIATDALKARTPEEVGAIAARKALNDADGTAAFSAERTAAAERARTEAIAGARKAIEDQSESLTRSAAGENRVAAAWRTSNEALAMRAEASKKAADDVARGLPAQEAEARQAEYLRERLAGLKRERAQATAEMNRQTQAQVAVNRQVDAGKIIVDRASEALQREVEVRRLTAQAAAAEGQDRIDLLQQVDDLSKAYERQGSAKAEAAAQSLVAEQDRTLAQMRLEADLLGKTTGERERALAVLRATQELQKQGVPLSSARGQQYLNNEALISDTRTAKAQFERLAQDVSGIVSGIFDDMFKAGNKGLAGFFDSFARGFSRIGTRMLEQNLIAPLLGGQAGFAGGSNPLDAFGKLFDTDGIKKAVNEGSQGGIFDALSAWLKPAQGADGKTTGGFASSKLGSGLLSAGVGASIGYQSQSPLMGAVGGALAGAATFGPIGAVVGAGAGLIGGSLGCRPARKKDIENERHRRVREFAACDDADGSEPVPA